MILEHEIPTGTKLYFGQTARKKRMIEDIASRVLSEQGYEEIVTPLFSYHQHQSISDQNELVRLGDKDNYSMSLRADSTIDVVKIIDKRLGRNTTHKKWFYIQPVYRYPSNEQYQVGAEYIGEERLSSVLGANIEILRRLELRPLLQLSNIKIPQILAEMLDMELDDFRHINIEKFLSKQIDWLTRLVYLHSVEEIDAVIAVVPDAIQTELLKIKELVAQIEYDNIAVAPMYYASMLYYDELFFRIIDKNAVFARGGRYKNEDVVSVGFAIYTDELVEELS